MTFRSFLWLVPFIFFLVGYYITYRLMPSDSCEVPSVIGKSTNEALRLFAQVRLNARIIAEKEDASLHEGTIISQNPQPLQKAKSQQSVFLVISKKPPVLRAPVFLDHFEQEVQALADKQAITLKKIFVPSRVPKGKCLAQVPAPDSVLSRAMSTVYLSAGTTTLRIMPDCTGLAMHDAVSFFKDAGMTVQVFHDDQREGHQCFDCLIQDQRPLPGTCIDSARQVTIQLSAG